MGLRLNKFLGYGLTDLQPGDERMGSWFSSPDRGLTKAEAYYEWLKTRVEHGKEQGGDEPLFTMDWAWLRHVPAAKRSERLSQDLDRCVAYDPEYGMGNVLVIRPLSCPSWHRVDDAIDYMEETYPEGEWDDEISQKEGAQVYRHGIWPFISSYMDSKTGRQLNDEHVMMWHRFGSERASRDDLMKRLVLLERISQKMEFTGYEEAKARVVPWVPEEIRDLAEFLHLFRDGETWRQLRPVRYTWWG